jgi:hypothetical protein
MITNNLLLTLDLNILMISIFLTSICYFFDRLYIDNEMNGYKKINYTEIEKVASTGDLVCFRWNCVDAGLRLFTKFSHVGMIVKTGSNKLYILETHPKEDPESIVNY